MCACVRGRLVCYFVCLPVLPAPLLKRAVKVVGTAKVPKSNLHNLWYRGRVIGLIHFPKVLRSSLLACVSYRRIKKVKIVSNSKCYSINNGPKGNYHIVRYAKR